MTYTVTTTTTRPTAFTMLFPDTMPYQYTQPLYNVPGFISKLLTMSADRLAITDQIVWESSQAALAFNVADPRTLTPSFTTAMLAYNATNNIHIATSAITTP